MSHSSHISKAKKKRSHTGRNLFVIAFIAAFLLIVTNAILQSNPSSTQRSSISPSTSSAASTNGLSLLERDFQVTSQIGICGYDTNHFKISQVTAVLQNNQSIAFHFLSANILFVNYTLANGTVVTVNEVRTDYTPAYGTSHTFNLIAHFKVLASGPKIIKIIFVITANVQEVPEPIVRVVSVSPDC